MSSRGRPKPKLRDLYYAEPTEAEKRAHIDALPTAQPIVTAVLGAVVVEHELEVLIRRRLPRKDDDTWKSLLDEKGPLYSLNTKIEMGYALRLFDEVTKNNLHIVRNIRNVFAHAKKQIDFDHPLIQKEINKAKPPTVRYKKDFKTFVANNVSGYRLAYASLCVLLCCELVSQQTRAIKEKTRRLKKKISQKQRQRIAALLLSPLGLPQGSHQQSFPVHQTGSPSSSPLSRLMGGVFGLGPKSDDKTGK